MKNENVLKTYKILFVSAIFTILFILIMIGNTLMHESAHKTIFEHYGIKNEVSYGIAYTSGTVTPIFNTSNPYEKENYESTIQYNLMNEIIGYNITTISVSFLFGCFFLGLVLMFKDDEI